MHIAISKNGATNQEQGLKTGFVSVAERIRREASDRPQAIAVVAGVLRLTFADLVNHASELARRFSSCLGGRPESGAVAIYSDDSVQMLIGALAAWKIGLAYLPVDPAGPTERLRRMLVEAGAPLVAANRKEAGSVPAGPWEVVEIEDFSASRLIGRQSSVVVTDEWKVQPDSLAYVIYTSGSTGQPKGVAVSQANLTHLCDWYRSAFGVTRQDRATQFAALTFDAAVLESWTNLSAGASLFVPDRSIRLFSDRLRDYLVSESITHCFAPTAIAEQLLELDWPTNGDLRFLLTGADTLRVFPAEGLPFQLINNYGPTECTVLATSGVIEPNAARDAVPSIGRPIPGADIYLLDSNLKPVAEGDRGEIYIGGAGVAVGYVGRPDLTAERFINSPFHSGARLYRTGDLGRKLPNGDYEFLGRIDHQIKIRGYRIEPGEVVHVLREHPAVKAAVVIAVGQPANRQLASYLILNEHVTAAELRKHLEDRLPSYMIPDYFIRLAEFPFNTSGKVDLTALPVPDNSNSLEVAATVETPETEIETELAAILSGLLGGRQVGLHDNFFRLGGHSLLAAQVLARVRAAFGVDLPLRAVFEAPTVVGLSAVIEERILATLASLQSEELGEGLMA